VDILHNRDATGCISKWAVELVALSINFKPRTAIKLQALVNKPEHWVMYFDGSLKLNGGGAGVLFISTKGKQLKYVLQILWKVSNNEDEYEALLHGLRLVISLGIRRYSSMSMDAYIMEVEKLENKFSGLEIHYVIQDHNVVADVLSKLGSTHA
jgi:hypothetical protein